MILPISQLEFPTISQLLLNYFPVIPHYAGADHNILKNHVADSVCSLEDRSSFKICSLTNFNFINYGEYIVEYFMHHL